MFKRIMKGGQKKPSKMDPSDPSPFGPTSTPVAPEVVVPPPSATIEPLLLFRDVTVSERKNLFIRKLQICCHVLDFSDTLKCVREKEIKRQTLMELVDFIQSGSGKITETCQEEMIKMVFVNIFRCLPPASYEKRTLVRKPPIRRRRNHSETTDVNLEANLHRLFKQPM